ncbi:phosphoribosylglycinamide formyltransferase [Facklamia hominis]|uniref:Phosphoribosylglycinamide formyltransferase n=1 Tax=Facklamia hominis TaxID=178214 RepID=A0AAJ1Q556_9LACT|nr:phosphoribosylglycinamide formyltransferase [Facklamia hominis]MDK7187037.1 phosphoribosylglycinamide formyltransferase [Facklamia hominis]
MNNSKCHLMLMASGTGSNVQALIDAVNHGQIQAEIVGVISDQPQAPVIQKAQAAGIDSFISQPKDYNSRKEWEQSILDFCQARSSDLILLAGFMRILSADFLRHYPQQVVNIHPSLLPAFPGRQGIKDAYDYGVKITGVTIHYVDDGVDTGPIIAQESLKIDPNWDLAQLESHIHQIEHQLYPATIEKLIQEKVI